MTFQNSNYEEKAILIALIFICLCLFHYSHAQNTIFKWAKSVGNYHYDDAYSIAIDSRDNVYTLGYFTDTIDIDPGIGIVNMVSNGSWDIFIQKLDHNGDLLWAKSVGGTSSELGYSITLDYLENIYVTGVFNGTADFDPGLGSAYLSSNGDNDIFILKLDQNGDFLWVKQVGGILSDYGRSITIDLSGNVYTTGQFFGTVDFDPGPGIVNLTSSGSWDMFVQKLDHNGNLLWVKHTGGFSNDSGIDIKLDFLGHVYTIGNFGGTVDFDPGIGITNLTSNGNEDIFIQKLDSNGNFLWAKHFGGVTGEAGYSITIDHFGNTYSTGTFQGLSDFDPSITTANLNSNGLLDIFTLKLDPNGNYMWAKNMGGSSSDQAYSIAIDDSGYIYTSGLFNDTADFDPGPGIYNVITNGHSDIFIQKSDSNGQSIWVKHIGGSEVDICRSIKISNSGNIYATGFFRGSVDFNPGINSNVLSSQGSQDIFILKLGPACTTDTVTDVRVACSDYTWIDGVTYIASNNSATHTLTNVSGCDSIITLNLTINSVSDTTLMVNMFNITSNNANATYQWLDCNNNYIPIANATSASFTATNSGNYAVELTELGCIDTSACISITNVNIDEPKQKKAFEIYPTPALNYLNISFYTIHKTPTNVIVFDSKGLKINEFQIENGNFIMDISNLNPGLYIIQVDNQYRKFIKK